MRTLLGMACCLAAKASAFAQVPDAYFKYYDFVKRDGVGVSSNSYNQFGTLDKFYGPDVLMDLYTGARIIPIQSHFSFAEWSAKGLTLGSYCVSVTYASKESRPLSLSVDGVIVFSQQLKQTTGGWTPGDRKTVKMDAPIVINKSDTSIRLTADASDYESWPHFNQMVFTYTSTGLCP